MNRTFLIFKHEFLHTIRRGGFLALTFALPVVALVGIGIYKLATRTTPVTQASSVGYVDEVGGFDQFTTQGNYSFVRFDTMEAATQALMKSDIAEYFVLPPKFLTNGAVALYTVQKQLSAPPALETAIGDFVTSNLLAGKVPADVITRVETPVSAVAVITLTSTGAVSSQQGAYVSVIIIPAVFSILLALGLIFTNIYLLQSLSGEKENRLMEILLSSVSTRELMAGKILGLGAAGLIEVSVWAISIPLLLKLAASSIGGLFATIKLPANLLALGVVYFILGYLVFGVLSACVAAVTSNLQDARNLSTFWAVFAIAPFWFFRLVVNTPNSPVWVVFSIFPFSAPVMVVERLGLTGVPAWQIAVSMGVMVLTIIGGILLAARLLRLYILMYGKRPSLGQIAKRLRSA